MSRLSYHQNVFDLLDIDLPMSPDAVYMIEESRRRCGKRLPASVRDWYTLDGVVPLAPPDRYPFQNPCVHLWYDYSNADHPLSLDEVLTGFERLQQSSETTGGRHVELLVENQAVFTLLLVPDGSEDPPVSLDEDPGIGSPWAPSPHFSQFLFDWFWRFYTEPFTPLSVKGGSPGNEAVARYPRPRRKRKSHRKGLWLRSPRGPALLPPYLDQLIDLFEEGPRHDLGGGLMRHTFGAPGARLRVTTDYWDTADGHSAWWLCADTPAALEDLARRALHVGALPGALLAGSDAGRAVLGRLGASR